MSDVITALLHKADQCNPLSRQAFVACNAEAIIAALRAAQAEAAGLRQLVKQLADAVDPVLVDAVELRERARAALAGGGGEKPRSAEKLPTLEDIHKFGVDITGGEDAADYICRQRAGESGAAGLRDKNERLRQSAEILKQQVSEERDRAEGLARDRWQKTQALQHVAEWMEKHTGHPRELEGCVRAALGH